MPEVARLPHHREAPETLPEFLEHLRTLHLGTVEEYRDWCAQHGFSRRVQKTWRERLKERSFFTRAVADSRLAQKRLETRKPDKVIEAVLRGELTEADVSQPHLVEVCRARQRTMNCERIQSDLLKLLLYSLRHADFSSVEPVIPHFGRRDGNTFIAGLLALARHSGHWVRPVSAWKPRTHNSRRQFSSLAHHLLAQWPVPPFMDSVWFLGDCDQGSCQQNWFLHLARGENIRSAELPLAYTKRMAHHFMRAPADYSVEAALRWGQIVALGGNLRLVRAVVGSRLGTHFEHEEFWDTVLQFFVQHSMLDPSRVAPIIDFIYQQKFGSGDTEQVSPPQPSFTMRGRTPASLLRQVDAWHRDLPAKKQPLMDWPRSAITPLEFVEGSTVSANRRTWTTTELLTTKALVEEGRTMCHCVATYARSCAHGQTSIWTLEVADFEARRKVLTLEVNRVTKVICQARGKRNATPSEKHLSVLRRWSEQAGLVLAGWL